MPDIPEIKIYKTTVSDGQSIFPMDTIEHDNAFWLVPQWLEHIEEGWITPLRIIQLSGLRPQDFRNNPQFPFDFSLNVPIPKSVFEGRVQGAEAAKYTVVEQPPIRFQRPPELTRH